MKRTAAFLAILAIAALPHWDVLTSWSDYRTPDAVNPGYYMQAVANHYGHLPSTREFWGWSLGLWYLVAAVAVGTSGRRSS